MKKPSPRTSNEKFKAAIARSIDAKISRLEARARPRAGESDATAAARARWLEHKADLSALELERRRGELVERAEVAVVIQNVLVTLRTRILSLPGTVVPAIARTGVELTVAQTHALGQTLKELARGWLKELGNLATVSAVEAYLAYMSDGEAEQVAGKEQVDEEPV
jgi:hypothetical protein